ncbi:hypothetical protein EDD21DRAFT_422134 [Dissophora ornata]|nr:hypothetical protein BGZ58_002863 [Dissophora ornata]KAI8606767.1 hypothetical protein EDD21DRAFT_422134 [Dissophora ornata]
MRFSIATAVIAISTLALHSRSTCQVSAALTPQERAAFELKEGPNPNYCDPCLQKAMHNHFPHACAPDLDNNAANFRPSGPNDDEERCVCVAFQNLDWMKADCSLECPYVHNPVSMQYFLPASKIEGCDKWIDFETGEEKTVEGFAPKDPAHEPEAFAIAPPPPKEEGEEELDGTHRFTVSVKTKDDEQARLELKSGPSAEIKKDDDIKHDATAEKKDEL